MEEGKGGVCVGGGPTTYRSRIWQPVAHAPQLTFRERFGFRVLLARFHRLSLSAFGGLLASSRAPGVERDLNRVRVACPHGYWSVYGFLAESRAGSEPRLSLLRSMKPMRFSGEGWRFFRLADSSACRALLRAAASS